MLDRISPIGFDEDDGIKMLLYGRSGTGKTTLWATFPKPILTIVCSGSGSADELRSIDTAEYRKTISQVTSRESTELHEIIEYQKDHRFSTLVLDHVTGFQDLVMKEILGIEEMPPQSSWGIATQQQYGQCTLQLKILLRKLLGLPCNVVIVAQEREFNNDNESDLIMPTVGAALSPSATGWLNTACSYICQTFIRQRTETKQIKVGTKTVPREVNVKGVDYCLRTAPDPIYTTKFRVPRGSELPDIIVDPDYKKIIKLVKQGG